MNSVLVGLLFKEEGCLLECQFDEKLSLRENLFIVEELAGRKKKEYVFYEPNQHLFISSGSTPEELGLQGYHLFYLFLVQNDKMNT